jgi:hypothetical protein
MMFCIVVMMVTISQSVILLLGAEKLNSANTVKGTESGSSLGGATLAGGLNVGDT